MHIVCILPQRRTISGASRLGSVLDFKPQGPIDHQRMLGAHVAAVRGA